MSHEFIITTVIPESTDDPFVQLAAMERAQHGKFHGYGEGVIYKAFDALEFDAGVSGCFGGRIVSKHVAEQGLSSAIKALQAYPDQSRTESIKCFLEDVIIPATDDSVFYIHFF